MFVIVLKCQRVFYFTNFSASLLTYFADVDFLLKYCDSYFVKFRTFMQGGMNLWYSSTLERFGQTQDRP